MSWYKYAAQRDEARAEVDRLRARVAERELGVERLRGRLEAEEYAADTQLRETAAYAADVERLRARVAELEARVQHLEGRIEYWRGVATDAWRDGGEE